MKRGSDGSPNRLPLSHLGWWLGRPGSRTWGTPKSAFFPFRHFYVISAAAGTLPTWILTVELPAGMFCGPMWLLSVQEMWRWAAELPCKGQQLLSQLVPSIACKCWGNKSWRAVGSFWSAARAGRVLGQALLHKLGTWFAYCCGLSVSVKRLDLLVRVMKLHFPKGRNSTRQLPG